MYKSKSVTQFRSKHAKYESLSLTGKREWEGEKKRRQKQKIGKKGWLSKSLSASSLEPVRNISKSLSMSSLEPAREIS